MPLQALDAMCRTISTPRLQGGVVLLLHDAPYYLGLVVAGAAELFQFFFGLLFGISVALLEPTCDLLSVSFNDFKIVVGKFSPLLFQLTLNLLPLAFHYVHAHLIRLQK